MTLITAFFKVKKRNEPEGLMIPIRPEAPPWDPHSRRFYSGSEVRFSESLKQVSLSREVKNADVRIIYINTILIWENVCTRRAGG